MGETRKRKGAPDNGAGPRSREYSAGEFAAALGVPRPRLDALERDGTLPEPKRRKRGDVARRAYTVEDLVAARDLLGLPPLLPAPRRQLFLNFKGGVGKTVIASNYAYRVALHGLRVLAVDLDAQGHLTKCLGVAADAATPTILDVLRDRAPVAEVAVTGVAGLANFDLVPATLALSPIEIVLSQRNAR